MPFDSMAMASISDEIGSAAGGQIQRIIQPSASSVALAVYVDGSRRWLVLSADARYARVHFSARPLAKAFTTPSPFVMLLRKYLESARLLSASELTYERVLNIRCRGQNGNARLVAEVMGKHSNIILVGEREAILGSLKVVTRRQSRVRPIAPGIEYEPPPVQARNADLYGPGPRLDPCVDLDRFSTALRAAPPDSELRVALQGLLPGCGSFLSEQVLRRAGARTELRVAQANLDEVAHAARDLYLLLQTRSWEPTTFAGPRGRRDFAPYVPVGPADVERSESASAAIDECLGEIESHDALASIRKSVTADIDRLRRVTRSKLVSLREGLEATHGADKLMENGRLVLAYQHAVSPASDRLEIPELSTSIALDPRLTPTENAERMFRRYRKLRDAERRIPSLVIAAETELARLDELLTFAELADSERTLRDLQRELHGEAPDPQPKRTRSRGRGGPARFRRGDCTALVGRSATENEEVTFRLAGRDDWWLHAREQTGAHVVLQGDGEPSESLLAAAASLAAHFSAGRSDTAVDVAATRVRDVRRIPGGPAGRVTFRNARTIRVQPGLQGWERV